MYVLFLRTFYLLPADVASAAGFFFMHVRDMWYAVVLCHGFGYFSVVVSYWYGYLYLM